MNPYTLGGSLFFIVGCGALIINDYLQGNKISGFGNSCFLCGSVCYLLYELN